MWLTKSCIQLTAHALRTVGFPFPPYSAALHQARYRSALHDGWRDEHIRLIPPSQSESTVTTQIHNSDSFNNSTLCIPSYWHIQQFDAMHSELLTHPTIRRYTFRVTDTIPKKPSNKPFPPPPQGRHIVEASWSHSDTPQSVNSSGWVISSSQRPLPDNSQP
jgi:hypothetical protein